MEFMKKTKADEMIELGATTRLVKHDTLEEAVAEMVNPEAMLSPEAWVIPADLTGDNIERTVQEFIDDVRKHQPCWGVCKMDLNEIHFWIGDKAEFSDVICLFAHEFGHLEPWTKDSELRSEAFGRVAVRAWCAVREALGDTWIKRFMVGPYQGDIDEDLQGE